jgi:site-specific recombinase XerD
MAARKIVSEGVRPMLVSEAVRLFLQEKEVGGLSPRTVHWYKSCLDMFIEFTGDKLVAKLSLDDGQRWILHMMHGDRYEGHPHRRQITGAIAIPTLNGRIRAIKNFSKYLEEEALTAEDVFRKLRQHKDTKRIVEVLSDEEKKRLIDAVKPDTWVGARMMVILALLIDTGMRVSELAGIEIEDIDYRQSRIKLHGKGDKYRFVPIGPDTIKCINRWLSRYRDPDAMTRVLLLDRYGDGMSATAIQKAVKSLGRRVGIPRIHPHLLRHTFGTDWLIHGGDLFSLQTIMGHSDLDVTKVYVEMSRVQMDVKHQQVSPLSRLGIAKKLRK